MATKNEEPSGTDQHQEHRAREDRLLQQLRRAPRSARRRWAQSIDGVTFKDIDVVKAGRALNIDAYDTAVVQNTRYENIRIEAADSSMIDLSSDMPPTWRTAANTSIIKDTYFTNVASDVKQPIVLHGRSATVNINGVHFTQPHRPGQGGHEPDRRRRQLEHQFLRFEHQFRPLTPPIGP